MLPDYCWGWLSSEFTKELAKKEAFPIELGNALVKQWRRGRDSTSSPTVNLYFNTTFDTSIALLFSNRSISSAEQGLCSVWPLTLLQVLLTYAM